MPAPAKLVTIVTVFEGQEAVHTSLAALGVRGFTQVKATGTGSHGSVPEGLFNAGNVIFTIVTKEPIATKILEWVEEDLSTRFASIAYIADVMVAPSSHFA